MTSVYLPDSRRARAISTLALLALLGAPGHAGPGIARAEPVAPPVGPLPDAAGVDLGTRSCDVPTGCDSSRDVFVDYDALGVEGRTGGEWLSYDLADVTRRISEDDLQREPELSVAVRLIISEVGADRLLANRYGLLEAVGILYTVDNRLDDRVYNPLDQPGAPIFPGCGPGGSFAACANAQQYLGMSTWRALDPGSHYGPDILEAAADVAVVAWWLEDNRLIPDFTGGATNYVHRCGDAGYGLTTDHCDRHLGHPRGDVRGANPFTGPLVFRSPEVFLSRRGHYSLTVSRWVDYAPWWSPPEVGAEERAEIRAEDGLDPDPTVSGLADGIGVEAETWAHVLRAHGQGA